MTRILCVRSGFAGDICLSTSSLGAIRQKHPDAHLTYACWKQYAELISLSPWVDEVTAAGLYMTSSFDKLLDFRHESLMDRNPDIYWGELHARQAANLGLLDLAEMESYRPELYIGVDDTAEKISEKPLVILNVWSANGVGWRLWEPFSKWADFVIILKTMGYKTVQLGGPGDPEIGGVDINLCGQTRLAQAIGVLSVASLFVGIDSFCAHVSHADKYINFVGENRTEKIGDAVPSVLIVGPICPDMVVPRDAKCVPVYNHPDCPGFCNHSFASPELVICAHKNSCMRNLSVEQVVHGVETVREKWHE